jgi:hypothetical protein
MKAAGTTSVVLCINAWPPCPAGIASPSAQGIIKKEVPLCAEKLLKGMLL